MRLVLNERKVKFIIGNIQFLSQFQSNGTKNLKCIDYKRKFNRRIGGMLENALDACHRN